MNENSQKCEAGLLSKMYASLNISNENFLLETLLEWFNVFFHDKICLCV